jgi:16S rRNA processing protein RimM
MDEYIEIGYTKKCHGVKGELKIQVEDNYLEDFLKAKVVFIEIKGRHVPHFIENVRSGNDLLLKLEEVDSKNVAHELTSKTMFLQPKQVLKKEEREFEVESNLEFEKYVDYTIWDMEQGEIGKIKEVVEFPQQEMAIIFQNEKEILIPLNESLIEKIEDKKQCIYMNLPEGLLEL